MSLGFLLCKVETRMPGVDGTLSEKRGSGAPAVGREGRG